MRTRLAILLALVLAVPIALVPALSARAEVKVFAQSDTTGEDEPIVGEEEATEGEETGSEGDESGQGEPEAETGAGEGETGDAAEEVGPIWTYQMAKIVIALLVLMALAIAGAYYQFVVKRQREGI